MDLSGLAGIPSLLDSLVRRPSATRTGTVTFNQRFDSALRLNVHAHVSALEASTSKRNTAGSPSARCPSPTDDEVAGVARRTAERVAGVLAKRGRGALGADSAERDPALASCYGAAARVPASSLRAIDGKGRGRGSVAIVQGFNVYAGHAIDGRDRRTAEIAAQTFDLLPIAA